MAENDNNIELEEKELKRIDRYICGPFRILLRTTKKRKHDRQVLARKLSQLTIDDLTELHNKKAFNNELEQKLEYKARYGDYISVVMVDIDDFKRYNDTYGHPQGDVALKAVGNAISNSIRPLDYAARWGGEEFAVILFKAGEEAAPDVAERIRKTVEEIGTEKDYLPMRPEKEKLRDLTVSAGVATSETSFTAKDLVDNADLALYFAKGEGKNRADVYDPVKHKDIKVA